jgi:hypothetical protein
LGFDSRELTPMLVRRIVIAVAETRSDERASVVLREVGGHAVSDSTAARLTWQVGAELAALRDAESSNEAADDSSSSAASSPSSSSAADATATAVASGPQSPPELAVVMCDGGRIRTRAAGRGCGVHDKAWRETKNACLLRMTHRTFDADPQPELPSSFRDPHKVAKLAEKEPLDVPPPTDEAARANDDAALADDAASDEAPRESPADWRPRRLVRTCLSSLACSDKFGVQMAREAQRRRFDEAPHRAFVGDGLPWNWSIWEQHFRDFTPILDFIHALSYVYRAALAIGDDAPQAWSTYMALATACWQGRVADVIAALRSWLAAHGVDDAEALADDDPRQAVATAVRYLTNNQARMDYPRYRAAGLPVTSAHMESLVKEINHRVKGTEMFWNDPAGAEAILQIRAAALCDDDRLVKYLTCRSGSPYTRRPTLAQAG